MLTDGQVRQGTWKRDNGFYAIEFLTPEGEPMELEPGNTWIELADIVDVDGGGVQVLEAAPPSP